MSFDQINIRKTPPLLDLSVVIPVMNEEDNIKNVADEITQTLDSSKLNWECIWVDDGSSDSTLDLIKKLNSDNSKHRYITFDRNYGQSAAFAAGFSFADGEIIIMMDGDGQNDPADIPMLVETMRSNKCNMVQGYRRTREDDVIRKFSSRVANGFRNWMTNDSIRDVGCSLRAIQRESLDKLTVFKGMHRFLPTMIRINGYDNIKEVPVNHRPRLKGLTKYGIGNRLWVGIKDTFAIKWMRERLVRSKTAYTSSNDLKSEVKDG